MNTQRKFLNQRLFLINQLLESVNSKEEYEWLLKEREEIQREMFK